MASDGQFKLSKMNFAKMGTNIMAGHSADVQKNASNFGSDLKLNATEEKVPIKPTSTFSVCDSKLGIKRLETSKEKYVKDLV